MKFVLIVVAVIAIAIPALAQQKTVGDAWFADATKVPAKSAKSVQQSQAPKEVKLGNFSSWMLPQRTNTRVGGEVILGSFANAPYVLRPGFIYVPPSH